MCKFNLRRQQKAVFIRGDKMQNGRERGEISNRRLRVSAKVLLLRLGR